jgi:hypothetical protein
MSQNMNDADAEELVTFTYRGRERRGYPEVVAYLNSRRAARREYEDIRAEADHAFHKAERVMRREAEDAGREFDTYGNREDGRKYQEARNVRGREYDRAREVLDGGDHRDTLINSPHREVAWIASHALFNGQGEEVEGYARDILAILPATVEQIWEEAKDNRGMCDVFDRFFQEAEAEGVFTNGEPLPGYRERAALRNYIRRNYGSDYVRNFEERLNPIIKAVTEHYETKLAEAKAEWQGLDEAWRSERSRRAAATRAANREAVDARENSPEQTPAATPYRSVISTQSAMTGETIRAEYDENGPVDTVKETEHEFA